MFSRRWRTRCAGRSYITAIIDYKAALPEAKIDLYLAAADKCCLELDSLVEQFLTPAPEPAEETISPEIDLRDVIRGVFTKAEATSRHHRFRLRGLDDVNPVRINANDLRLVLQNLEDNACKYSPAGSLVTVTLMRRPDAYVQVDVSNAGDVHTRADMSAIFLRSHRLPSSIAQGIRGAGLGLAISKAVVQSHNGHIWARPRRGGGLVVAFELPLSRPA